MSFFEYWKTELELWQKIIFIVGIILMLTVFLPITLCTIPFGIMIYVICVVGEWYEWYDINATHNN